MSHSGWDRKVSNHDSFRIWLGAVGHQGRCPWSCQGRLRVQRRPQWSCQGRLRVREEVCLGRSWRNVNGPHTHKMVSAITGNGLNCRRVSETTGLGTIWLGMLTAHTDVSGGTATPEISAKHPWIVSLRSRMLIIMVTDSSMVAVTTGDSGVCGHAGW